jgi:ketosteroid isomerase-like protein
MTTNQMAARENKDLIRGAFAVWVNGHGDVFDLLADDVRGTITGSSPIAGTYASRKQFQEQAIQPLSERPAQPIQPTGVKIRSSNSLLYGLG